MEKILNSKVFFSFIFKDREFVFFKISETEFIRIIKLKYCNKKTQGKYLHRHV